MRRPYVRGMPTTWWLQRTAYLLFMLREMTAIFIAAYCVILLVGVSRLQEGPEAWDSFLAALGSPFSIVFHAVALLAAVYHSITWFNLTPKVIVPRIGEERISPVLIAVSNYLAWAIVSALLIWIVLTP